MRLHQTRTMNKRKAIMGVPDEIIMNKILLIRGKKVMIDMDLSELYGVETKRLNEQVKRNIKRFPKDFMFQLNKKEKETIMNAYPHLTNLKYSPNLPHVFTEYGAVMLASVLNSDRAIEVNIQIVRIFTRMRELLLTHKDILIKLEQMEKQVTQNSEDIQLIFEALKQLLNPPQQARTSIGFKIPGNKK
jgi:ORF6N domain